MSVRLSTGLRNAISNAFDTAFANCFIDIYSGTMPTTADLTESGTKLVEITESADGSTGLNFDSASSGVISKASAETWQGTGIADGTATWARIYANAKTTGASSSAVRLDVSVGASGSGAEIEMASTSISIGGTVTIDSAIVTTPANA